MISCKSLYFVLFLNPFWIQTAKLLLGKGAYASSFAPGDSVCYFLFFEGRNKMPGWQSSQQRAINETEIKRPQGVSMRLKQQCQESPRELLAFRCLPHDLALSFQHPWDFDLARSLNKQFYLDGSWVAFLFSSTVSSTKTQHSEYFTVAHNLCTYQHLWSQLKREAGMRRGIRPATGEQQDKSVWFGMNA